MTLNYYPPVLKDGRKVVEINHVEVESEYAKWENALIGYVLGGTPSFEEMLKFVYRVWNFVTAPRVYLHDEGYSCSYLIRVLIKPPYCKMDLTPITID